MRNWVYLLAIKYKTPPLIDTDHMVYVPTISQTNHEHPVLHYLTSEKRDEVALLHLHHLRVDSQLPNIIPSTANAPSHMNELTLVHPRNPLLPQPHEGRPKPGWLQLFYNYLSHWFPRTSPTIGGESAVPYPPLHEHHVTVPRPQNQDSFLITSSLVVTECFPVFPLLISSGLLLCSSSHVALLSVSPASSGTLPSPRPSDEDSRMG